MHGVKLFIESLISSMTTELSGCLESCAILRALCVMASLLTESLLAALVDVSGVLI